MTDTPISQHWDPNRYQENAGFVAVLGKPVLDAVELTGAETVLDLGCGDGALTLEIAKLGCQVKGVDYSPDQIAAARERGLDASVMDGQKLEFDAEFDVVISNATLHWIKDQDAVIGGVWRALRPGGRFSCEMGGYNNVNKILTALGHALARRDIDAETFNPFTFPDVEEQKTRLEAHGFQVSSIALIDRPTPLPGDIEGWLWTFCESFLLTAPEGERAAIISETREELDPVLRDEKGVWVADYVRLRFLAAKPV